ncbi:uncharacterized protein K02A2.6-like [Anopheles merus]|uniref:uncharacterized protein K02A2.6-like n=1 Tax=Anopheles merus TaxID=30066 RepID=UPI001BE49C76|nr:uncharacterized protein K02A2.6-like [Anopheles merus]
MAELQQAILLMTELLQKLAQPNNTEQTLESLATNISEFSFDPENGITFEKWYSRYTDLFESDAKNLDDSAKVRLLLRKLDTPSHVSNRKYVPTLINGVATRLQLDTVSDITVISKQTWNNLGNPSIIKPTIQAINASGKPLHLMGSRSISRLVNFEQSINDSLGHCRKLKVKLFLKPNAKPIFCPKRPVPFNTIPLVDAELTRLQSLGILEPVDFSEWAAPIVAVRKPNGRVRICADYSTGLNEALEPNHYPLPTPEEIFAQLNGSTVFSIVDLSDAYLQLEVDDDSKKLLTINTHRGLFRFNRLAPGVKSASGVFQRVVDGMITDIPGVRSFIDDVIVFGKDISSHATSLNLLFQRLKEYGFHVKAEKCHFFQSQLGYLGHIVDIQGIRPDPEKVKAIAALPPPTNVPSFDGTWVRSTSTVGSCATFTNYGIQWTSC